MSVTLARRPRARLAAGIVLAAVAVALAPTGLVPRVPADPTDLSGAHAVGAQDASARDADASGRTADSALAGAGGASGRATGRAGVLIRTGERPTAPDPHDLTGYRWPLARGRLTLPFKAIPGGTFVRDGHPFHDGIDIASFCGDRVVAAHDGIVLAAGRHFDDLLGWLGDLGPYYAHLDAKKMWNALPIALVVDDGNGYRSVYAHFRQVVVRAGQRVTAGQLIGYEGRTGHASGCHVHYGLFSPLETARFGVRADVAKRLVTPPAEIARIDPLIVLPGGAAALATRRFGPGQGEPSAGGSPVPSRDERVRGESPERL